MGAPAAIEQLAPKFTSPTVVGQFNVTAGVAGVTTMLTGPLILIPGGKASVSVIGAVVAAADTAMVIL